jgi:hypothetical protein
MGPTHHGMDSPGNPPSGYRVFLAAEDEGCPWPDVQPVPDGHRAVAKAYGTRGDDHPVVGAGRQAAAAAGRRGGRTGHPRNAGQQGASERSHTQQTDRSLHVEPPLDRLYDLDAHPAGANRLVTLLDRSWVAQSRMSALAPVRVVCRRPQGRPLWAARKERLRVSDLRS